MTFHCVSNELPMTERKAFSLSSPLTLSLCFHLSLPLPLPFTRTIELSLQVAQSTQASRKSYAVIDAPNAAHSITSTSKSSRTPTALGQVNYLHIHYNSWCIGDSAVKTCANSHFVNNFHLKHSTLHSSPIRGKTLSLNFTSLSPTLSIACR